MTEKINHFVSFPSVVSFFRLFTNQYNDDGMGVNGTKITTNCSKTKNPFPGVNNSRQHFDFGRSLH